MLASRLLLSAGFKIELPTQAAERVRRRLPERNGSADFFLPHANLSVPETLHPSDERCQRSLPNLL